MIKVMQDLQGNLLLELTEQSVEVAPWWLWVQTLGQLRDSTVGSGIERIWLTNRKYDKYTGNICEATFLVKHTDDNALVLDISLTAGQRAWTRQRWLYGDNYKWWMDWVNGNSAGHHGGLL